MPSVPWLAKRQKSAGQTLFAGVENMVQQVLLDTAVALEQMLYKVGGDGGLALDQALHGPRFDENHGGGSESFGGDLMAVPARQASFAKEVAAPKKAQNGQASPLGDRGELDESLLDVMNAAAGVALSANGLAWLVMRAAPGAAQDLKSVFGCSWWRRPRWVVAIAPHLLSAAIRTAGARAALTSKIAFGEGIELHRNPRPDRERMCTFGKLARVRVSDCRRGDCAAAETTAASTGRRSSS